MRNLAQHLISEERRLGGAAETQGRAALRVCERLRESLSALAGARGFRTLLVRALALAKGEAAWLGQLEVGPTGTLVFPAELERAIDPKEAARGGAALVGQLLELLETLIGDALTRRIVRQLWPKAALGESKSGGKK